MLHNFIKFLVASISNSTVIVFNNILHNVLTSHSIRDCCKNMLIYITSLNRQTFSLFSADVPLINSKINGTPKGVYLPISKLHSILAVANLLAHNNLWQVKTFVLGYHLFCCWKYIYIYIYIISVFNSLYLTRA